MKILKIVITISILGLGISLFANKPVEARESNVAGGVWSYGIDYNWRYQQSTYSNFYHPNYHRSTALQDYTNVHSHGVYYYNGRWWQSHHKWSYAKTGYWSPWQWQQYYDYLTW